MNKRRFAINTLGCKLNFSESSTISRQFIENGYQQVDFSHEADVYIINTCSVTQLAEKKCRNVISKAVRTNPEAKVIVVGCYAQLNPDQLSEMEGVHLVVNNRDKQRIFEYLDQESKKDIRCSYNDLIEFAPAWSIDDRTRSFLKIQDGCDYFCSYCTIPKARGKSRSDSIENVIENACSIVNQGVKEIVLTGVNVGDFGKHHNQNLYQLLEAFHTVDGLKRLRLSSIEPNLLEDRIIELVGGSSLIMPHFHIPLQCGTDRLLKLMNRRYTTEEFRRKIETIRSMIPDAFIAIDLIVGVPEETEEDFRQTVDFIRSLDLSELHIFTYSQRPGTKAERMQQIPISLRRERSQYLHEIAQQIHIEFCKRFEGQVRPVLIEKSKKKSYREGLTDNYLRVEFSNSTLEENNVIDVKLLDFNPEAMKFRGSVVEHA
ncbi:MAG TPA: tRNA (N(6)-L-threonylcarbamoyladenosine(37)-C(2))-methylthiotransferase MtaB [Salinivirgaceae bacterium]|nr:tRNA (N(6)-L-threonylcarbamoyladenosine(37)-C(2))-methylthiotransferase MtaB [Salinivirgaceae bacterium]